MADAAAILKDPNYINANPATKQAIFDKHVAVLPDFANANAPTKQAILSKFGLTTTAPNIASTPDVPATTPAPKKYNLADVPGAALGNSVDSAGRFIGGMANMVAHPLDTAGNMVDAAVGAVHNLLPGVTGKIVDYFDKNPEETKRVVAVADAVGGAYKARYGSYEAFKRTMAEDPVGFSADLSTLFGAGSAALTHVAPSTAKVLSTAAQYTNPATLVAKTAAIPVKAAGKAIDFGYNAMNPKAAAYVAAADGRGPAIINALTDPNRELVPGSTPTAAQAAAPAASPKFAALGQSAEKVLPAEFADRAAQQDAARLVALRTVGGTPAKLSAAEATRAANASVNYGAAEAWGEFASAAKVDKTLRGIAENPYVKDAMPDAVKLSTAQGVTFKSNPVRFLHNVKISLGKALSRTGDTALDATEQREVKAVQTSLVNWLETKIPDYKTARTTFAADSKPINQMEVGQYLEGKLVPALDEEAPQKAAAFAGAVKDAPGTIKRATGGGGPRFDKLTQVLTKDQADTVYAIRDDLARAAKAKLQAKQGAGTGPDASVIATDAERALAIPNFLNRTVMVANNILRRVQGKMDRKLAIQLAAEMLDPDKAAVALSKALDRAKRGEAVASGANATGRAVLSVAKSPNALAAQRLNDAAQNQNSMNQ